MDDLIARLEAADGPQFVLDVEIWKTCHPADWKWQHGRFQPPAFTASIDAALGLVPEGCFWRVGHDGEGADPSQFRADILHAPGSGLHKATAPTPALAICIAALRAHLATPVKSG